jgi:anthranilate synthase/aminodeoxychorismate synthase-like glutamine amidotransferase
MKTLLIDAEDSFVYIIAQYLRSLGGSAEVVRSDRADVGSINDASFDLVLLGPGPGTPADSGHTALLETLRPEQPVFGVCLGHQAIAEHFGATVGRASVPMHGKRSAVEHDADGAFAGLPTPMMVTRYHSLVVLEETVPDCLQVTARSTDDLAIMGLRHRSRPIEAVQFHPESIGTDHGLDILRAFVRSVGTGTGAR